MHHLYGLYLALSQIFHLTIDYLVSLQYILYNLVIIPADVPAQLPSQLLISATSQDIIL